MIADTTVANSVTLLDQNPDYKIIMCTSRKSFAKNDGRALLKGVVVDTETTGTNPVQDAIIELGMDLASPLIEFCDASAIMTTNKKSPTSI